MPCSISPHGVSITLQPGGPPNGSAPYLIGIELTTPNMQNILAADEFYITPALYALSDMYGEEAVGTMCVNFRLAQPGRQRLTCRSGAVHSRQPECARYHARLPTRILPCPILCFVLCFAATPSRRSC